MVEIMKKKAKILVVGSFMMDLVASAPRVPKLGEIVIGTSFQTALADYGASACTYERTG